MTIRRGPAVEEGRWPGPRRAPSLDRDIEALIEIGKFEPPEEFREKALLNDPSVYDEAKRDFEGWWERQAEELHWFEKWERVLDDSEPPFQ